MIASSPLNQQTDPRAAVLELDGVTKRFPGILANDQVSLTLHRGEILALLGENGAGKSTLMNIIYGLYHADDGSIRLKGQTVRFASPREAIHSGIGMVHQHFQLIPVMTVAENVTLGEENSASEGGAPVQRTANADESAGMHNVRRAWGVVWRVLLPVYAIVIGLLIGQIALQISLIASTHLVSGPVFDSFQFERLPLVQKAVLAFAALYPVHTWVTLLMLWLPLVIGCITGGLTVIALYRHARRTWLASEIGGTLRFTSPMDSIATAVSDLLVTISTLRDQGQAARRVRELSQQYGLQVDPDALIENLPVGMQQRVEIVKALYRRADILILDEPTAVLTPQEGKELFKIMRKLAAQGVSIIFITHKLKEVLEIADSVVVMRGGKVVGTATPAESSEASLAALMVGRAVLLRVNKTEAHPQAVVLEVQALSAIDDRKAPVLDGVNFSVRAGEVLGVAGVQGNGQTELVEVLTGLRAASGGRFSIGSTTFEHVTPRQMTHAGAAHIPEDRQKYGMVSSYSVADNLVLNVYEDAPFATAPTPRQLPAVLIIYGLVFAVLFAIFSLAWSAIGWPLLSGALNLTDPNLNARTTPLPFIAAALIVIVITLLVGGLAYLLSLQIVPRLMQLSAKHDGGVTINRPAIEANAQRLVEEFDIRTPSIMTNGGNLSGGNQQKMVVAREFSRQPRLLIASQPTRGIDVGSIEFIHKRIIAQRDAGAAVLLVSAELDEIIALSDRIAVMYRGAIIDTLPAATATREQLGLLMAGVKGEVAPA